MNGLVFVTGGLDSTLVFKELADRGDSIIPLFIKYNQWQEDSELEAAKRVHTWVTNSGVIGRLGIADLQILEVNFPKKVGHSAFRSLAFVGLAGMFLETQFPNFKPEYIATGYHGEHSKYPEARVSFQHKLGEVLGIYFDISYIHPLGTMSNKDIGIELSRLPGFSWKMIYNCFWNPSCGSKSTDDTYLCGGCRGKVDAMIAAGVSDKELLGHPNAR